MRCITFDSLDHFLADCQVAVNCQTDPSDPMSAFLNLVDNMVEELGNAVAFASLPLHNPPSGAVNGITPANDPGALIVDNADSPAHKGNTVQESFYVVPPGSRAAQGHVCKAGSSDK
jgi:hypothetical protein